MSKLKRGDLRDRLTFEQLSPVLDSHGDPVQDPVTGELTQAWQQFHKAWGNIHPLSAAEFVAGQQIASQVTTRITIPYIAGITAKMRIRNGSTVYNIQGVIPDPESGREWITLACSSGVNDG